MDEDFRYPDRAPPTPTSSVVLWIMLAVVLAGSVALGLTLAEADAAAPQIARTSSTTAAP